MENTLTHSEGGSSLLDADDLALERGGRLLFSQLSVQVEPGEIWQVAGANGAGKTSLLRILSGLSRYGFEGRVRRNAVQLYLGHKSAVKALLSPIENLCWHPGGEAYGRADAEEALQRVDLVGYEDVPCGSLSAGQLRRVNLARWYLSSAPLWILDEPFTAIDRRGVAALEQQFETHVAAGGAVVMTSHQAVSVRTPVRIIDLDEQVTV